MKDKPSIYVGTYARYNNGSLFGEWVDLTQFKTKAEFYAHIKELHKAEHDPEYMFQDMEYIPDSLAGESWISDNLFDYIKCLNDLEEDEDRQSAFIEFIEMQDSADVKALNYELMLSRFDDSFRGNWKNEEEYGDEHAEQMGYFSAMETAGISTHYFDSEAYARDLFLGNFNMTENGNVFETIQYH